jgi:hypothetical protein
MFVYDLDEKQMLNVISLVIEQRKKEFDRIAKVRFFSSIFMPCEGDITFRTPVGIYFSLKNQIRNIYAKKKLAKGVISLELKTS